MQLPAWIVWLDRRFGTWSVPHLVRILVAMNAGCFVLDFISPGFVNVMLLDPYKVLHDGEWWRVITFLFASGFTTSPIGVLFFVFGLIFLWNIGEGLESEWGSAALNIYILIPVLLLLFIALGPLGYPVSNAYLASGLFLAFATLFPDYEIMLFPLPIPIKVKWIGMFVAALVLLKLLFSPVARPEVVAGLSSYVLFFGYYWHGLYKLRIDSKKRMKRFRGEE